jgi:hypothetical protein
MENRSFVAIPRALVWAGLVAFTLYSGIRLAAGPGRDFEFRSVEWTGGAIAQVLIITAVLAAAFARAAYMTYRTEVMAPPAGTLVIPGARMSVIADGFLSIVGGLLLLVTTYMVLRIPEMRLAGATPQFANYHSVKVTPNVLIAFVFGSCGFLLMIVRRYVWVFTPGKPVMRYWARAFSRGRAARGLELYWTFYYVKRGYQRIPTAHWLRARDPSNAGFFRDCDLELAHYVSPEEEAKIRKLVNREWEKRTGEKADPNAPMRPLGATPEQLRAIEQAWQQRFAQVTGVMPPVVPEDRKA